MQRAITIYLPDPVAPPYGLLRVGRVPAGLHDEDLGSAGQGGHNDGKVGRWPPNYTIRIVWKEVRRFSAEGSRTP